MYVAADPLLTRASLFAPDVPYEVSLLAEQIPYGSRNIAVSEAEAHLRRLVKLGHAEAVPGSEPVTYVAV